MPFSPHLAGSYHDSLSLHIDTNSTVPRGVWRSHATQLADHLRAAGELDGLTDERWYQAIRETPRHLFVPGYYTRDAYHHPSRWCLQEPSDPASTAAWLATVYSTTTLVTALSTDTEPGNPTPVSASTAPDHALRMLHALCITDQMRVLEVGTGTGYLTALLAHRLGADHVTSIDIDPDLTDHARGHLAALGLTPTLNSGDGARGALEHAPFDRILAACTLDSIPSSWITQTRPGALVLAHVRNLAGTGTPLLLRHRSGDILDGRFMAWPVIHLPVRRPVHEIRRRCYSAVGIGRTRTTPVDPTELNRGTPLSLLAQLHLPTGTTHHVRLDANTAPASYFAAPDGSWAEVSHTADHRGLRDAREAGPTALISAIEDAWNEWGHLRCPQWTDFGITATPGRTIAWHGHPTSGRTWPLT
ncbi:MAG: methyltransferase domain-containing protein [Pseudonocardia sp.]